ncbi:hypothetical protein [Bradyrhizobium sp.]|jgi:hypothetical protein|uniref:hypothetical protein n=1 Tax=Bradyrhizobium sp. TaxID=376 RepID=UPI0039E2B615
MFEIESSLRRLRDNVGRFMIPSIVMGNVRVLEDQIEFRRQALREIEAIRYHLKGFAPRKGSTSRRRRSRLR